MILSAIIQFNFEEEFNTEQESSSEEEYYSGEEFNLREFGELYRFLPIPLAIVLTILNIWTSIKLLTACEIGRDPKKAIHKARIWRNFGSMITLMTISNLFVLAVFFRGHSLLGPVFFVVSVFYTGWRAGSLYIVCKYIRELKEKMIYEDGMTPYFNVPIDLMELGDSTN